MEDDFEKNDVEEKDGKREAPEKGNNLMFTVFSLEEEEFGVPVDAMDEIVQDIDLYNIPSSPSYVLGATRLRGNVIPVIDPKYILDIGKTGEDWKEVLILGIKGEKFAIPVDGLKGMISPSKEQLVDPTTITNLQEKMFKWIVRLEENKSVRILDIKELIRDRVVNINTG